MLSFSLAHTVQTFAGYKVHSSRCRRILVHYSSWANSFLTSKTMSLESQLKSQSSGLCVFTEEGIIITCCDDSYKKFGIPCDWPSPMELCKVQFLVIGNFSTYLQLLLKRLKSYEFTNIAQPSEFSIEMGAYSDTPIKEMTIKLDF